MAKFKVKKSRQFSRKENEKEKKKVKLDKEKQKLKKESQKSEWGLAKWMLGSSLIVVLIGIAIALCQELFAIKRTIITQPPIFKVILPTEKLRFESEDPFTASESSSSLEDPKESAATLYNELDLDAQKVQQEFDLFDDTKWTEKSDLEKGYRTQEHKSSVWQQTKSLEDAIDEINEPLVEDQESVDLTDTDMTNKDNESLNDDKETVVSESNDIIMEDGNMPLPDDQQDDILSKQIDNKLINTRIFSGKTNEEGDLEDRADYKKEDGDADSSTKTYFQDKLKLIEENINDSLENNFKKADSVKETNNIVENDEKVIFNKKEKVFNNVSTENNKEAKRKENNKNYEEGKKHPNLDCKEEKLEIVLEDKSKDDKYEDTFVVEDEENGGLLRSTDKMELKKLTTLEKKKDSDTTKEDKNKNKVEITNLEITNKDRNSLEDRVNDQKTLESNKTSFKKDLLSTDNGAQNPFKLSAIKAAEEIRKQESLFLKEKNDEENDIDIINNNLEEEDHNNDDFDESEYQQFSDINDEKPYHVEEKRIKIVKDSDYVPISDGLKKHILREGYGNIARKGEQVTLHCMGFLDITPPKMFWNTKELGQRPFSFIVGKKQVIKGWDEAALTMKTREKSKFKIEAKKAYGKFGFAAWEIPPNADLIMEFEMIAIKPVKHKKIIRMLK